MKIIDKNMLKLAEKSFKLSAIKYPHKATDNEIVVFSNYPVLSIKRSDHLFTADNLKIIALEDNKNYQDYRFSDMIYTIEPSSYQSVIEINIPYAHSLSTIQAKYSSVFVYEQASDSWKEIKTEWDGQSKLIRAEFDTDGYETIIGVFPNYFWYSTYTQQLAKEFPEWSFIYKNKESNGQRFLNFFGLAIEELEEHFNWIRDQRYIGTADLAQLDWVYAYGNGIYQLDETDRAYLVSGEEIPILYGLEEFIYNSKNHGVIFDYDKELIYSQYEYEAIAIKKIDDTEFSLEPRLHQIWNIYDEFGLLLGVKRIFGEKNYRFIERILDVFRYPSNTSEIGITHGIARDLDMIQRYTKDNTGEEVQIEWKDDSKPLLIKNKSGLFLDHRTLRIDGRQLLYGTEYDVDTNNNIIIHPLNEFTHHFISIIQGIEKYELHDKDDDELYGLMYKENGLATPLFESWVSYIRKVAPVMWDDFQWDKGYWDTISKDLTGVGFVPNHWDSSIEKWKGVYVYE